MGRRLCLGIGVQACWNKMCSSMAPFADGDRGHDALRIGLSRGL